MGLSLAANRIGWESDTQHGKQHPLGPTVPALRRVYNILWGPGPQWAFLSLGVNFWIL